MQIGSGVATLATMKLESRRFRTKTVFLWVLTLVVVASVISAFMVYRFPLELNEFSQLRELKKAGVSRFDDSAHDVKGLVKADCGVPVGNASPSGAPASCGCVLLVHGLGDSALTWRKLLLHPSESWPQQLRWYAIDLPAHGANVVRSSNAQPWLGDELRVRAMASHTVVWMKSETQCREWTIVGNSFGGWISAWITKIGTRKLVGHLALVDSTGLKHQRERDQTDVKAQRWITEPSVESLKEFQRRAYFKPRELEGYVWEAALRRLLRTPLDEVLKAQSPEDYLDAELAEIKQPTLVFWGKNDQITPLEDGRELSKLVKERLHREAQECGHLPQKECPLALHRALEELWAFGAF